MALFRRNKNTSTPAASTRREKSGLAMAPSPVVLDRFFGDLELAKVAAELQSGNWQRANEFLDERNDPDWTERALRNETDIGDAVYAWVEEAPSCRSLSFKGAALIAKAWEARGGGLGHTVGEKDAMTFHLLLMGADTVLDQAIELDPASAEPWGLKLTVAMGLGKEIAEAQALFDEAHKRAPFHTYSVRAMNLILCEKWGGSEEQVLEFARWVEAEAPADSPSRITLSTALYECAFVDAMKKEMAGEGRGFLMDFSAYLNNDRNDELFASMEAMLDTLGEDGIAPPHMIGALNQLLFTTGVMSARHARLTLRCLKAVDNRAADHPWYLLGDPATKFAEQQQHSVKMCKTHIEMERKLHAKAAEMGIELNQTDAA